VSLPELVQRVIKEQKLAALARRISFDVRLGPAEIVGDASRVRVIVDNLVSNAIKYSPRAGVIAVALSTERDRANLDVIDEGHGVDPAERSRIFETFYQGNAQMEGRVKGSGLGLAIAREYAIAHGGGIDVQDRADGRRGAHFRMWLPLAPGMTVADATAPRPAVAEAATAGAPER
jgi:two-component system sensor histidine kinase GlrK